jgi:transcriptional regulator with XRE-family HTH domain
MQSRDEKISAFIRLALKEGGYNLSASYSGIVGLVIAYLRHEKGLSQQELARISGISQGTISRIELGQADITLPQIDAFAEVFNTTPSLLLQVADEFRAFLEKENISVSRKPDKETSSSSTIHVDAVNAAVFATTGALLGGPVGLLLGSAIGAIFASKQNKNTKK